MNIPAFLFQSIKESIMKVEQGKASTPLHQGLLKIIFKHAAEKIGQPRMIIRGVHSGNPTGSKKEAMQQIECEEDPRRSKRLKKTAGSDKKLGLR